MLLAVGSLCLQGCGDNSSASGQPLVGAGGWGAEGGSGGDSGSGGSGGGWVEDGGAGSTGQDASQEDGSIPLEHAKALLELYALDIWAQGLPLSDATLTVRRDGNLLPTTGWPVVVVPMTHPGTYELSLTAPEHEPLEVQVQYDGSGSLGGATLLADAQDRGHGLALSHEQRTVGSSSLPVHTAYLGLRHAWYSAQGRPARRGNKLEFLMDGEQAWARVYEDLQTATQSMLVATWWWQSDFELIRNPANHAQLTPTQRWANTILGVMEGSPAHKRVLVGQFWGQDSVLAFLNTDSKLKAYAQASNDKFEFMGQANLSQGKFVFQVKPFLFSERVRASWQESADRTFGSEEPVQSTVPPHLVDLTHMPFGVAPDMASYHQKFAVVDDRVAFVGGMNLKSTDWDTSEHAVFEFRRMEYKATTTQRLAVKSKESLPDRGPRKDYMVRIEGPAAQDVADVFQIRWQHQLDHQAEYAQNSTPFTVKRSIPEQPAGVQAQITATLPDPFLEHAIAETWFNAIRRAQRYVFIEDQYFRMPMLNNVLAERMEQVPALKLVVITKPINEWTDLGCPWTYISHNQFKSSFPTRYRLMQLRAFDTVVTWGIDETESRFQDMDTHSKLLIVDDKFMSVGSCNKNNRGLVYEGELNIAVVDEPWVRAARRRVFENFLPPGVVPSDDVETWWAQLGSAAAANDAVYANWDSEGFDISLDGALLPAKYKPKGMLYSMDFPVVSECNFEDVGPDMTIKE
jgi:phosphatidylserine/phosphatidylglycerophosphate/cardiolipin synthase-like enzyme